MLMLVAICQMLGLLHTNMSNMHVPANWPKTNTCSHTQWGLPEGCRACLSCMMTEALSLQAHIEPSAHSHKHPTADSSIALTLIHHTHTHTHKVINATVRTSCATTIKPSFPITYSYYKDKLSICKDTEEDHTAYECMLMMNYDVLKFSVVIFLIKQRLYGICVCLNEKEY
ncbi:hypothetical protein CHARACLAT_009956 [Characodon lateralis]|uniref:Uncharacterized protein n=1 Tax=Characodon lateralis TaxID=208331 RepID=A0ABU7E8H9_9TELE|nr:hypothetical protein [Characodon lateralis]